MDITNDTVGAVKKDWKGADEDRPLISLSGDIHTSQQTRGEHHLSEGHGDGPKQSVYGEEMSPNGIATSKARTVDTETTQQMMGQLSTPESDKVS